MTSVSLGPPISTGGTQEHAAGRLIDAAAHAFRAAATWQRQADRYHSHPHAAQAAIDRARGRAYLDAITLLRPGLTAVQVDRLYTEATGQLPG